MQYLKQFILVFVCFYGCQKENGHTKTNTTLTERTLKRALLNGYYTQINENIGISIYQNNIYCFSVNEKGFSKDKFLLHLIDENGSFVNKDFLKNNFTINDSLSVAFSKIDVIQKKINFENATAIRIGQFLPNEDKNFTKVWSREILTKDIINLKEKYKNQLPLKKNLISEDFKNDLKLGKFFKTRSDFYLLISDTNLYFITSNNKEIDEKVMLHFIREDNTFNNLSFMFEDLQHQQFLEPPYNELKIVKIIVPSDDNYPKVRIGQFNEDGNIWVQEFFMKDIFDNQLLKYENEFQK